MAHSHNHTHGHSHGHSHDHAPADFGRAFVIGIGLNISFVILEAIYGVVSHSLALLADAGHNLGDVLGLGLAWFASSLARRAPTAKRTYGFRGSTILAALFNAVLLYTAVGAIAWESIRRFSNLAAVDSGIVIWVAALGILINTATAVMFWKGRKNDANIRGAFLHMASDAAASLGVVISGLVISVTGWLWLDPAVSLLLVAIICVGTWSLLRESVDLALDAVPEGINSREVQDYLATLPGITEVHDLHIWGMSTTESALTVHLVKPDAEGDDATLAKICRELHDLFGIEHTTIQWERGSHVCEQAPASRV